jgi:hypothetical protein
VCIILFLGFGFLFLRWQHDLGGELLGWLASASQERHCTLSLGPLLMWAGGFGIGSLLMVGVDGASLEPPVSLEVATRG